MPVEAEREGDVEDLVADEAVWAGLVVRGLLALDVVLWKEMLHVQYYESYGTKCK